MAVNEKRTTKIDANIVGIWTCRCITHNNGDWLATVVDNRDGTFAIRSRFRDGKTDDKNWMIAKFTGTRDDVIKAMRNVSGHVASVQGTTVDELLMIDGDVEKFAVELAAKPWAHFKKATI